MKNIIEILKNIGVEIPADKESELLKDVAENYKTVAEFDKKVNKMQTEIDDAKTRATAAEDTLKGFEGKNFEEIEKERNDWKEKYELYVKEQQEKQDEADLNSAIENAIKQAKGKNAKAIIANLDLPALKSSHNRDTDIASAIKAMAEAEDTAFLFETDPENNRAKFTGKMSTPPAGGQKLTTAEIMKLKNQYPDLDISQYLKK